MPFIYFLGLTYSLSAKCQFLFFFMFLTPFRGDFETESKWKKIPEKFFLEIKKIEEIGSQARRAPEGPQAPTPRPGGAPSRLVGPMDALCPRSLAYIFP